VGGRNGKVGSIKYCTKTKMPFSHFTSKEAEPQLCKETSSTGVLPNSFRYAVTYKEYSQCHALQTLISYSYGEGSNPSF
jgi:hypothetical protein